MATATNIKPRIAAFGNPDNFTLREYPEAASQSFVEGDLVYLVAGLVTVCATAGDPQDINTVVLGIAARDASGTTNTSIPVYVIRPDTIVYLNVKTDGADHVLLQGNFGQPYGVYKAASNVWSLNINESTLKLATAISVAEGSVVGDTNAIVGCKFVPQMLQEGGFAA